MPCLKQWTGKKPIALIFIITNSDFEVMLHLNAYTRRFEWPAVWDRVAQLVLSVRAKYKFVPIR